jgi:hypothetical protein
VSYGVVFGLLDAIVVLHVVQAALCLALAAVDVALFRYM